MTRHKFIYTIVCIIFGLVMYYVATSGDRNKSDYLVIASECVMQDAEWAEVAYAIAEKHDAEVITFATAPREVLEQIREAYPRYVAIVDKPENIGRDYVIDLHTLCREVDDDIYGDFLWGIITLSLIHISEPTRP